jgi:hypothetical protein
MGELDRDGALTYRIHAFGGGFIIVAYDDKDKPVRAHPLSTASFESRATAEAAIDRYVRLLARADRGSKP